MGFGLGLEWGTKRPKMEYQGFRPRLVTELPFNFREFT